MNKLTSAKNQAVMIDTCILLVGADKEGSDPEYGFEIMKSSFIQPMFNYFQNIKIHEKVIEELDEKRRTYVDSFIGKNVEIVSENDLFGKDPVYTTTFNDIAEHELFNYRRGQSKNRGDVYSLAYAAHFGIPFLSTKDGAILSVMQEINALNNIEILGFEYILTIGYLYNDNSKVLNKRLSSLYKSQCGPAIKQNQIPPTFNEFLGSI
jgi:hypothetical protein